MADHRVGVPLGSHPIEKSRYTIRTPQLDRLAEAAGRWVRHRFLGNILVAPPRTGKTRATGFLTTEIPQQFPGVPVVVTICDREQQPTRSGFYLHLLTQIRHTYLGGNEFERRDRFIAYLEGEARKSGQDRLVMIFDQAQNLHSEQYEWLMFVYDSLENAGISLITMLFGQPELRDQRDKFQRNDRQEILARFMREVPANFMASRLSLK